MIVWNSSLLELLCPWNTWALTRTHFFKLKISSLPPPPVVVSYSSQATACIPRSAQKRGEETPPFLILRQFTGHIPFSVRRLDNSRKGSMGLEGAMPTEPPNFWIPVGKNNGGSNCMIQFASKCSCAPIVRHTNGALLLLFSSLFFIVGPRIGSEQNMLLR